MFFRRVGAGGFWGRREQKKDTARNNFIRAVLSIYDGGGNFLFYAPIIGDIFKKSSIIFDFFIEEVGARFGGRPSGVQIVASRDCVYVKTFAEREEVFGTPALH